MKNSILISKLEDLQKYYKLSGDRWRERAYTNAIYVIKKYNREIKSISEIKKAKKEGKMRGVGKGVMDKIQEFLEEGEIHKANEAKKRNKKLGKKTDCINLLTEVYGIGKVKATYLCDNGYDTIAKLREGVKKNSNLLNNVQKLGLKYYEKLKKRLPHDFIHGISIIIRYILNEKYKGEYKMRIAGSYRRKTETSGDIDCLISPLKHSKLTLREVVKELKDSGLILTTLGEKKEKFIGVGKCQNTYFHIDIEFIDLEEWGSALLYFTGSQMFNINMRHTAKEMGYRLNQHGLFEYDEKVGKKICSREEKEIFDYLKMEWVEPWNR